MYLKDDFDVKRRSETHLQSFSLLTCTILTKFALYCENGKGNVTGIPKITFTYKK